MCGLDLTQDALKLQAFVKAVLNLRVRVNVKTAIPTNPLPSF